MTSHIGIRISVLRVAKFVLLAIALCASTHQASAQRFVLDPVDTRTLIASSNVNAGSFGACFGTAMIDRGPLLPPVFPATLTPTRVFAGFNNDLQRGADPLPCNHFSIVSRVGIVKFGLPEMRARFANRRLTLAVLNIIGAIPVRAEGLINMNPCPAGGNCLRGTTNSCRFQVAIMQQPVTADSGTSEIVRLENRSARFVPRRLLTPASHDFTVSGTGALRGGRVSFDVTREFRAWAIDGVEPGIAIFTTDPGVRTTDFATDCRVVFDTQLDVSVGD
jgi:hypothetical protein